jgi:hypothetical protein
MWQWEKSINKSSWMDAMGMGAMTNGYTPEMSDEGYYLRAMVTYTDAKRSGRMAYSMATESMVTVPADQMGTVTLSTQEPMVGMAITADLTDADGMVTGQMWQWQKSMDKSSWMAATGTGAMTATYTPAAADEGYYLRATVTYRSTQEPMVGMAITADLTDADGMVTGQMWQWEKSEDKSSWMDATGTGAMTMSYTPAAMDVGYYLRATAIRTVPTGWPTAWQPMPSRSLRTGWGQ